jgi:hypothetical protein
MIETPKGETIPQTVENLQKIMVRDAITMMEMAKHTIMHAQEADNGTSL